MKTTDELIKEMTKNILAHKAKILDDFCRAYLASKDEKYFLKLKEEDFRRLVLVETRGAAGEITYQFQLKKGRLPKIEKLIKPKND